MRTRSALPAAGTALLTAAVLLMAGGGWLRFRAAGAANRPVDPQARATAAARPATPAPTPSTSASTVPRLVEPSPSNPAVFTSAPVPLRRAAARFVRSVCVYDARNARRRDFLTVARAFATAREVRLLAHSQRARLSWPVLRARRERTRLRLLGISLQHTPRQLVVVEALLTTHTTAATLREFRQFTLQLTRTRSGWKVSHASGPGLQQAPEPSAYQAGVGAVDGVAR